MHLTTSDPAPHLRSPCTEGMAAFRAFSRILREAGHTLVVMHTAPTGHTLLRLDAAGAYDRGIQRPLGAKAGGKGLHITTPMIQLQDPKQTKVLLVRQAETTPVLEAASLQRAHSERAEIDAVASAHSWRCAVVPSRQPEPVGALRLPGLCSPELTPAEG